MARIPRAKRLHLLPAAALGAAALLAMTGCSRASSTGTAAASTTVDSKPATGTVSVWAPSGDATALKTTLAAFEKANPKLKVDITLIPSDSYNTKLQTAISAGTTPDVAFLYTEAQSQFISPTVFTPVPKGLVDPATFFPGAWDAGKIGSAAYSVPWYTYTNVLIYRKDLADKAGVSAPTKLSDTTAFFKSLQSAGATHGYGADVGFDTYTAQAVATFAFSNGATLINADQTKWELDTPAVVDAVKTFGSFFTQGTASASTPQFLDAQPYFVAGKTASLISGPWVIAGLDSVAKKKGWTDAHVGTAVLPAGTTGSVGHLGGGSWGVLKKSANAASSWKVIRYLDEESTQIKQFEAVGSMPALQAAWSDPLITKEPLYQAFYTQLKTAKPFPSVSTWNQVSTAWGKELQAVALGTETADQAMKNVQQQADSIGTGSK